MTELLITGDTPPDPPAKDVPADLRSVPTRFAFTQDAVQGAPADPHLGTFYAEERDAAVKYGMEELYCMQQQHALRRLDEGPPWHHPGEWEWAPEHFEYWMNKSVPVGYAGRWMPNIEAPYMQQVRSRDPKVRAPALEVLHSVLDHGQKMRPGIITTGWLWPWWVKNMVGLHGHRVVPSALDAVHPDTLEFWRRLDELCICYYPDAVRWDDMDLERMAEHLDEHAGELCDFVGPDKPVHICTHYRVGATPLSWEDCEKLGAFLQQYTKRGGMVIGWANDIVQGWGSQVTTRMNCMVGLMRGTMAGAQNG